MAKRVKITLVENPTPTVFVGMVINYGAFSGGAFADVGGILPESVAIGVDVTETTDNLYAHYLAIPYPSWQVEIQTISRAGNVIIFDFDPINDALLSFDLLSTQSSITIEEEDVPSENPVEIGLVRSTLSLRLIPNLAFDKATLDIYNWSGNAIDIPTNPNYALSKPVVQLGQSVINFDVNELIKSNINNTIANYTLSGLQPIPLNQSCWSYYMGKCFNGEDLVYTKQGVYLALYGYGYFQDLYNPQPLSSVLIDNNSHTHIRGYDNRVHFLTNNLTTLTVNGSGVTVALDTDFNYNNVASINLNDYDASATTLTLVFTYPLETRTLIYTVKEECKYEVINCVFINKYGLPQSLFFTKAQKRSDEVESSDYRGLISEFGVFNTTDHVYKTFNSNGRSKVSCNTDYLNESENETFKQLLLSEQVWLIEDGIINPVTVDKKSIEYKTKLVDKLIQYVIDFKYSFDMINQC